MSSHCAGLASSSICDSMTPLFCRQIRTHWATFSPQSATWWYWWSSDTRWRRGTYFGCFGRHQGWSTLRLFSDFAQSSPRKIYRLELTQTSHVPGAPDEGTQRRPSDHRAAFNLQSECPKASADGLPRREVHWSRATLGWIKCHSSELPDSCCAWNPQKVEGMFR